MAILIAIAIPVFSAQLDKARKAVDENAMRAAKSLAEAHYLLEHSEAASGTTFTFDFVQDNEQNLVIKSCTNDSAGGSVTCSYALDSAFSGAEDVKGTCKDWKGLPLKVTVKDGIVTGKFAS